MVEWKAVREASLGIESGEPTEFPVIASDCHHSMECEQQ